MDGCAVRVRDFLTPAQVSRLAAELGRDPGGVEIRYQPIDGPGVSGGKYRSSVFRVPAVVYLDSADFPALVPTDGALLKTLIHELMHWRDAHRLGWWGRLLKRLRGDDGHHGDLDAFNREAFRIRDLIVGGR